MVSGDPRPRGLDLFEPNIEWVLGRIDAKPTPADYVGRGHFASPATGPCLQQKEHNNCRPR